LQSELDILIPSYVKAGTSKERLHKGWSPPNPADRKAEVLVQLFEDEASDVPQLYLLHLMPEPLCGV